MHNPRPVRDVPIISLTRPASFSPGKFRPIPSPISESRFLQSLWSDVHCTPTVGRSDVAPRQTVTPHSNKSDPVGDPHSESPFSWPLCTSVDNSRPVRDVQESRSRSQSVSAPANRHHLVTPLKIPFSVRSLIYCPLRSIRSDARSSGH